MSFEPNRELSLMVALARVDQELHEREASVIRVIGRANGFSESELDVILASSGDDFISETMSQVERFMHLFYLVHLMKADGRILISEMSFCQRIASRLKFDPTIISELASRPLPVDGGDASDLIDSLRSYSRF